MSQFFQELKRRKVLKTLGVYGAAAMVITTTAVISLMNMRPVWISNFQYSLALSPLEYRLFPSKVTMITELCSGMFYFLDESGKEM